MLKPCPVLCVCVHFANSFTSHCLKEDIYFCSFSFSYVTLLTVLVIFWCIKKLHQDFVASGNLPVSTRQVFLHAPCRVLCVRDSGCCSYRIGGAAVSSEDTNSSPASSPGCCQAMAPWRLLSRLLPLGPLQRQLAVCQLACDLLQTFETFAVQ